MGARWSEAGGVKRRRVHPSGEVAVETGELTGEQERALEMVLDRETAMLRLVLRSNTELLMTVARSVEDGDYPTIIAGLTGMINGLQQRVAELENQQAGQHPATKQL